VIRAAAEAFFPLTGRPIRIAVATVSGLTTVSFRTSGQAPSAWNPIIRGRLRMMPRFLYVTNPAK